MPTKRQKACCNKLKEMGVSTKNLRRAKSPEGNKVRKEAEKGIRTGKPKPPRRKPRSK